MFHPMHPFLPALSRIFLIAGDGTALFMRLSARNPLVAANLSSLGTVTVLSLLIGGGLGFWLRRFGLRFPSWVAILSLSWVVALAAF
jgi:hypothetical protein